MRELEAHATVPDVANRGLLELDAEGDILVETRAIDELHLPDVKVIKIDAQGAEPAIIRGATKYLQRCRPLVVFEDVSDFSAEGLLERIGYRVSRLTEDLSVATID